MGLGPAQAVIENSGPAKGVFVRYGAFRLWSSAGAGGLSSYEVPAGVGSVTRGVEGRAIGWS